MDQVKLKNDLIELSSMSLELLSILLKSEDGDYKSILTQYKNKRADFLLEINKDLEILKIADPVLRKELKDYLKNGAELIHLAKSSQDHSVRDFGKVLENQFKPEFEQKRLSELEFELFYDKYDPTNYVYDFIETGTIVIKHLDFPDKLQDLIIELRECIILKLHIAAGIMLRTIIDVAIDDIMKKNFPEENHTYLAKNIGFLKNRPKFSSHASTISLYLKDLNELVHGKRLISPDQMKFYAFDIVLERIQELYESSE